MRKLSELCLQVSWVRPNDGVWCFREHGHTGDHSSHMETYSGAGDQDAHKEPWILDVLFWHGPIIVQGEQFEDDLRTKERK